MNCLQSFQFKNNDKKVNLNQTKKKEVTCKKDRTESITYLSACPKKIH